MEKIVLVNNLSLPQVLLDHILSFGFYTLEQSIEKNKKKYEKLLRDISDVRIDNVPLFTMTGSLMYCIYIQFPVRQRKVIYANLCGDCNNFIHLKRKSFGCRCLF